MTSGLLGAVPAAPHPQEAARLAALRDYGVLDSLPEPVYDDIAFLASYICETPIALVSLVDQDRQWFKAKVGTEINETSRDVAFCAHAILAPDEIFVVSDALEDPRFATNPLVREDPKIRFYAGAPLNSPSGLPLGTLCAMDHVPHRLSPDQARALGALSREVVVHLELRRLVANLSAVAGAQEESGGAIGGEIRDELREASQSAATASSLVGEAMEQVLEAESRLRNLVHRLQSIQTGPTTRPPP
ncbi:MAG: GAF domain-containing protein [Acidimicrobiia bacterium]